MFEIEPRQVLAQPLDMEMLEIEHALAKLAARRAQQAQRLGVLIEEIGVTAEIGDDVAGADLAGGFRRCVRLAPVGAAGLTLVGLPLGGRSTCGLSRGRSTTARLP